MRRRVRKETEKGEGKEEREKKGTQKGEKGRGER